MITFIFIEKSDTKEDRMVLMMKADTKNNAIEQMKKTVIDDSRWRLYDVTN